MERYSLSSKRLIEIVTLSALWCLLRPHKGSLSWFASCRVLLLTILAHVWRCTALLVSLSTQPCLILAVHAHASQVSGDLVEVILCILSIAVRNRIVLWFSLRLNWLPVNSALTDSTQLARVVRLALLIVLLLHYHHWIVDLEEIVAHLSRIGVATNVDSGCSLEDRLLWSLCLVLAGLGDEFKLRLLLGLLDEIVEGFLQHAAISGFRGWIVWPSGCNHSLLVSAEFGWLRGWASNLIVRRKASRISDVYSVRLLVNEFDFQTAISWLRLARSRSNARNRVLLVVQLNLILLYVHLVNLRTPSGWFISFAEL